MPKGDPIPVRFDSAHDEMLTRVSRASGLSKSELIRRAVYMLNAEIERRGGKVGWIMDELGPDQPEVAEPKPLTAADVDSAKALLKRAREQEMEAKTPKPRTRA